MTTVTKPNDLITGFNGLTKKEYFAAMAMQALITVKKNTEDSEIEDIVINADYFASQLIIALNHDF